MTYRVGVIQMVSSADVSENLAQAEYWIQQASQQGVQLVVLPENFAVLDSGNLFSWGMKERESRVFSAFLQRVSRDYGVVVVGGTIPMVEDATGRSTLEGKVRAASLVFDAQGECIARYDKMHLFDVSVEDAQGHYRESARIEAGNHPEKVEGPWGCLGLSVCYDLRFPEHYAYLSQQGCRLFTVPSAFTYQTGKAHWEILLKARAIETQSYVLAANQGGQHNDKRRTWGHSMIVDPWGSVLGCLEQGAGLVQAELDWSHWEAIRAAMPIQQHRRYAVSLQPGALPEQPDVSKTKNEAES